MENKIKHLEMIENIIERMTRNCFQLKGWTMTLVVVAGSLGAKDMDKGFFILAFIPIFIFWLLDTFYLEQERKYKALYREVAEKNENDIDFNLNTRKVDYTVEEKKKLNFIRCLFSFSEILFYAPLAVTMIVLVLILKVF